ncbi:MAG: sporulation integral membrane protein YlbJ, partial [Negativicutes bacterium]|nr:sporulation integral membrane protein YlbJ [Negativicutes bacterium]
VALWQSVVRPFALSMGLASGYPMDAVITSKFRKNKLCTAVEAERLLSFTNTADPLFMFGAVAVGMFGMPEIGATIALAHYLSSFIVGIIFRYHGRGRDADTQDATIASGNILIRAFRALYNARQEDKRSIGQLLGDSVKSSMNTILLIGGFIIVFSVILRIVSVVGLTSCLNTIFAALLSAIGFSANLAPALVSGLFEIDLGAMAASQADAPLIEKVALSGAIIAWSGLSVHGQVASIVIESGIRMAPYIAGRFLHAVLAGALTFLLMDSAEIMGNLWSVPVMFAPAATSSSSFWLHRLEQTGYLFTLLVGVLIALSLGIRLAREIHCLVKK